VVSNYKINVRYSYAFCSDVLSGNGEEEREGCCIKRATASDYIHKVKYLEHSRSAVSRDAVTTR
jgi:hypothetical protein